MCINLAAINGQCNLILKNTGLCSVKRLPKFFDLEFSRKHYSGLQKIASTVEISEIGEEKFMKAFILFFSKDLVTLFHLIELLSVSIIGNYL